MHRIWIVAGDRHQTLFHERLEGYPAGRAMNALVGHVIQPAMTAEVEVIDACYGGQTLPEVMADVLDARLYLPLPRGQWAGAALGVKP